MDKATANGGENKFMNILWSAESGGIREYASRIALGGIESHVTPAPNLFYKNALVKTYAAEERIIRALKETLKKNRSSWATACFH